MSGIKGISAFPISDENMFNWAGTIEGVDGTMYEGLKFQIGIEFPQDYPYTSPRIHFETPCYHPNVDVHTGAICLDILKESWSAIYNVQTILLSLQSLLGGTHARSSQAQSRVRTQH